MGRTMKARNYRKIEPRAYTRKKYIRGHQPSKIVKFTMGDPTSKFTHEVALVSQRAVQVRHNALESVRISVNRILEKNLGKEYCLRILPYPHHILRENKMIFGAHADRLQDGMRGAFGKAIGSAARVKRDQPIVRIGVNSNGLEFAKKGLKRVIPKLPMPCKIKTEEISD
jgi:large subunit ribosomal protein L10e